MDWTITTLDSKGVEKVSVVTAPDLATASALAAQKGHAVVSVVREGSQRAAAYREEADPLFFQWQRGEATKQDWLAAVEKVKKKYPTGKVE